MVRYTLSERITSDVRAVPYRRQTGDPVHRPLRVYTQDPDVSIFDAPVTVAQVPWEPLTPGPCGALFVVRDHDETLGKTHLPVDLDSAEVLRGQGLSPSTSDPRFAQQMTYALSMLTFERFSQALGRVPEFEKTPDLRGRLTIRPHFAKEDNAFYDSDSGRLDFGYVVATSDAGRRMQKGAIVYTALSHDVVIHETTHALLDGMRPLLLLPSNPDVAAFHEGFADLVAMLMRFRHRALVERAMQDSATGLTSNLLTEVMRQWGRSEGTGRKALRHVLLEEGDSDAPVQRKHRYNPRAEAHELGAVLVAAVFEAMNRIFQRRTSHLRRLARVEHAPESSIIALLASEAQKVASDFLNILIRAIDYCPPMDLTFGEFLRAVITADYVTVPDDPLGYREALVYAFRRYGIRVNGVADLTEESLRWFSPEISLPPIPGLAFDELVHKFEPGWPVSTEERTRRAKALGDYITQAGMYRYFGIIEPTTRNRAEPPEIQSVRTMRRLTPDRELDFHVVAEVTQRRKTARGGWFYGGSTVILDETGIVRYAIGKGIMNVRRERATAAFLAKAPAAYRRAVGAREVGRTELLKVWHRGR